jgi:spermidine synthase
MGAVPAVKILAALLAAATAAAGQAPRLVHTEPGMFGPILVIDEGETRTLRFGSLDGDDQSIVSLADPGSVPMDYIRYAAIGLAYADRVDRVLMVGLGGGTFTGMLRRLRPDLFIDVVEIDPAVVRVAKTYFGVREDPRYVIHLADGAAWMKEARQTYDLILVDAYGKDGVPEQLATAAFFHSVRARLSKTGVLVVNLSVSTEEERRLRRAIHSVFDRTDCLATPGGENILVLSRPDGRLPAPAALVERSRRIGRELSLPFDLVPIARRRGVGCRE